MISYVDWPRVRPEQPKRFSIVFTLGDLLDMKMSHRLQMRRSRALGLLAEAKERHPEWVVKKLQKPDGGE